MSLSDYQSGTKLIRGWDEVIKYSDKKKTADNVSTSSKGSPEKGSPNSISDIPKIEVETEEDEEDRVIDHLMFVIHG